MEINDGVIEADFLEIPNTTKYWFVRAGSKAEYYRDFKLNNFIAIGDNEIKLNTLKDIPELFKITDEVLKDRYKHIFNEQYIFLLQESSKYKNMEKSDQADEVEKTKRSSTISSNKTFSFVEEMNIGDIILVPYKRSEVFLIGIVVSDVFDEKIDHEYVGPQDDYAISDYEKKRKVIWLKEISQSDLPEKLLWIQTGQRAIFNITDNANDVNPILSNEFIYDGYAHIRVNVGTPEKINTTNWLQYQLVISENSEGKADDIFQKNKVQSIGHIVVETLFENWESLLLVGAALFGEIDFEISGKKIKTHGPLSFLVPGAKKRQQLESDKKILENEIDREKLNGLKLDNEAKKLKNEKETFLFEQLKTRPDLISQTELQSNSIVSINRSDKERQALNSMKISQKSIGNEISLKKQMESPNLMTPESETKVQKEEQQ